MPAGPAPAPPAPGPGDRRPSGHGHAMRAPATLATGSPQAVTAPQPNLSPGPGPVMPHIVVDLVFWLPSGRHYTDAATGPADSSFEAAVESWVTKAGGTDYAAILGQYYDSLTGTHIGTDIKLGAAWVDTAQAYPHAATTTDPLTDSDVQGEVGRALAVNGWANDLSHITVVVPAFEVYECGLDGDMSSCTAPGTTNYCAYHETTGTAKAIYAFVGNIDTCYTSSAAVPDSQMAATVIGLMSHEVFEAATDPYVNRTWNDPAGKEIGDLCEGKEPAANQGADIYLGGTGFHIQPEWSNDAHGCAMDYGPTPDHVLPPELTTTAGFDNPAPAQGATFTYTLRVANSSDTAVAKSAKVSVAIAGATVTAAKDSSIGGLTVDGLNGGTAQLTLDTIPVHGSDLITITATADTGGRLPTPCPTIQATDFLDAPVPVVAACPAGGHPVPTTGAATTVSTTSAGQQTAVAFTVTDPAKPVYSSFSMGLTNCTTQDLVDITLLDPTGSQVESLPAACRPAGHGSGELFQPITNPVAGTYQILVAPRGGEYGYYTFQVYAGASGPSLPLDGTPTQVPLSQPGQSAMARITTTTPNQVVYTAELANLACGTSDRADIWLYDTTGSRWLAGTSVACATSTLRTSELFSPVVLPTPGSYAVLILPTPLLTGTLTLQASGGIGATTIVPNGLTTAVVIGTPGRASWATVTAAAVGRPLFSTGRNKPSGGCSGTVTYMLYDPSGGYAGSGTQGCGTGGELFSPVVLTAGTYTVEIIPDAQTAGEFDIQMENGVTPPAIPLDGTTTTVSTSQAGQSTLAAFTVTDPDQLVFAGYAAATNAGCGAAATVDVYDANGVFVTEGTAACNASGELFAPQKYPAGTYTIELVPDVTAYGSYSLQLSSGVAATAVPLTGAQTAVTTTSARLSGFATFTTTAANQTVFSAAHTALTGPGCGTQESYYLYDSSGAFVSSGSLGCQAAGQLFDPLVVATAGTYTIEVFPAASQYGTTTIQLWSGHVNGTIADPGTATVSTTTGGQSALLSFTSGGANHVLNGTAKLAYPAGCSAVTFWIYDAEGGFVSGGTAFCNGMPNQVFDSVTLPTAGTYYVEVVPNDLSHGSATVTFTT